MTSFTVVVCEAAGQWAARLRPALEPNRIRLRETRRLVDCQSEVSEAAASVVLLEWTAARRAELADFVERISRRLPRTWVLALAQRGAAGDEPLAREAGVVHFVSSPRALGSVARLIRRQRDRAISIENDTQDEILGLASGNSG